MIGLCDGAPDSGQVSTAYSRRVYHSEVASTSSCLQSIRSYNLRYILVIGLGLPGWQRAAPVGLTLLIRACGKLGVSGEDHPRLHGVRTLGLAFGLCWYFGLYIFRHLTTRPSVKLGLQGSS